MKLWAFGTSPHGLGLSPEAFWSLTQWEFLELKAVYDEPRQRWAIQQAAFYNANFDTDGTPWIPADFLGHSSRKDRHKQTLRDKARVISAEMKSRKSKVEDLPEWAKQLAANRGHHGSRQHRQR